VFGYQTIKIVELLMATGSQLLAVTAESTGAQFEQVWPWSSPSERPWVAALTK